MYLSYPDMVTGSLATEPGYCLPNHLEGNGGGPMTGVGPEGKEKDGVGFHWDLELTGVLRSNFILLREVFIAARFSRLYDLK